MIFTFNIYDMKKFSEKHINDYKILELFRIGFEFEFFTNKLSFYKLLEELNAEMDDVNVHGFRQYHSDFIPTANDWKIEPDLSGGSNMIELVTGPMAFFDARYYLIKMLNFIIKWGYTNDRCSIHINISFNENVNYHLKDINILKLISRTDEDAIYKLFPSRENNIYAKSIKKLIPFKDYDFSNITIDSIKNNIKLPADKYFGVNFVHMNKDNSSGSRLEYRYIGGENYEFKIGDILELTSQFCIDIFENITIDFTEDDINNISDFLEEHINGFKNFLTYKNFLIEYPDIKLQIDQVTDYSVVSSYYPKIYKEIYELLQSVENISECIINYFTIENKIEVVNATFTTITTVNNISFIGCDITNGIFENCEFTTTDLMNADIMSSKITNCNIDTSKLTGNRVDSSDLLDCHFVSGYLNSFMKGGLFRAGKMGPYGALSDDTVIVSNKDNFFNTVVVDDDKKLNKKW